MNLFRINLRGFPKPPTEKLFHDFMINMNEPLPYRVI